MITALVSKQFIAGFGDAFKTVGERTGKAVSFITPPEEPGSRLSQADFDRIDCTFFDRDIRFVDPQIFAAYGDALVGSKSCKWLHIASSGVTLFPFISELDKNGAVITSSPGSNAEPVAQTGFTGLLMLARGFPGYIRGQHKHEWRPLRGALLPDDLRGQTLLLIGVGAIGRTFAVGPAERDRLAAQRFSFEW